MDIKTAKNAVLMVGLSGGSVSVCNADGEIIATEGLTAGRYNCALWVPFMSAEGDTLAFEGQVTPMVPSAGRVSRIAYGAGSHDSGANPDFTVTSADRMARELQLTLNRLNRTAEKAERREAHQAALAARVPQQDVDVIDAGDTPEAEETPPPASDPVVENA